MPVALLLTAAIAILPSAASARGSDLVRAIGCIVRATPGGSSRLALSQPGSPEEAEALASLQVAIGRCLARNRVADSPELRTMLPGLISERLYLSSTRAFIAGRPDDLRTGRAGPEGDRPAPGQGSGKTVPAGSIPGLLELVRREAAEEPSLGSVASCTVGRAPQSVDALLRTRPESQAERNLLSRLAGALSACLDAGAQMAGSRGIIRAALARAMYRYIEGPPAKL